MINYFIVLAILSLIYFIPNIICAILLISIICLIKAKAISTTFKIIIPIIVVLLIFIIFINIYHQKNDDLYMKMNLINDNKTLIGLSKEQVVELLGEPEKTYKQVYVYDAGYIFKEISFGHHTIWAKTH